MTTWTTIWRESSLHCRIKGHAWSYSVAWGEYPRLLRKCQRCERKELANGELRGAGGP